jgi:hypothetical protein
LEERRAFQEECRNAEEERRALREGRKILEEARNKAEQELTAFHRRIELENKHIARQRQMLESKLRILEEELRRISVERKHLERLKEFYRQVNLFENAHVGKKSADFAAGKGEMFFTGVKSRQSLRKRYRDLIKIYHPDNVDGDSSIAQEIMREYDKLNRDLV